MSGGKHSPQSHDTNFKSPKKNARRESRIESLLEFRGRAGIAQDFKENLGACESLSPFNRHEKVKASA